MQKAKAAIALMAACSSAMAIRGDITANHGATTLALTTGPALEAALGTPKTTPGFRRLALSGHEISWRYQPTSSGTVTLRYAILARDLTTRDAVNCADMKPPSHALETSDITAAEFRHELVAAFAIWSNAAAIDFVETPDDTTADIVIGAEAAPNGHAFTNVTPSSGERPGIDKALICLSPDRQWKIGFDGNLDVYDLRYTLAHEIGHAIGLDHPGRTGHLMSYRYSEERRGLTDGDRAGAIALYGPR